MKKHKKLVGIFGGVVAMILLAYWGYWSLEIYHAANRNADIATEKWQKSEDYQRQLSKTIDERDEALSETRKVVEEAETKVKTAEEAKTVCEAKVKELETALAVKTTPPKPPIVPVTPASPPVKAMAAKEVPDTLKMAILGKGEGPENPFIRQLVHDLSIVDGVKVKVYGKVYDLTFKDDKTDKKTVKKWAQRTAHLIALNGGFVNFATGKEVRVKVADNVAYPLVKCGDTVIIGEYEKDTEGNFKDSPSGATQSSYDEMNLFKGNTSGVQAYEYVWKEG